MRLDVRVAMVEQESDDAEVCSRSSRGDTGF